MDTTATLIFIIAAFSLGAVLIMKRDTIPPGLKRGLALITIIMVASAFVMIVASFLNFGS